MRRRINGKPDTQVTDKTRTRGRGTMLAAVAPLVLTAALAAGSATAGGISSSDPQSLLAELESMGYDVWLDPYESGRPRIKGRLVGVNYSLAFYSCLDDMTDCLGLMFTAGFDMRNGTGLDVANTWNQEMVYSRAYIDNEDDPFVQMPVPISRDLDSADVARLMDLWESTLEDFTDEIGFKRHRSGSDAPSGTGSGGSDVAPGRTAPGKSSLNPL